MAEIGARRPRDLHVTTRSVQIVYTSLWQCHLRSLVLALDPGSLFRILSRSFPSLVHVHGLVLVGINIILFTLILCRVTVTRESVTL